MSLLQEEIFEEKKNCLLIAPSSVLRTAIGRQIKGGGIRVYQICQLTQGSTLPKCLQQCCDILFGVRTCKRQNHGLVRVGEESHYLFFPQKQNQTYKQKTIF
jgi:hypothetical protein